MANEAPLSHWKKGREDDSQMGVATRKEAGADTVVDSAPFQAVAGIHESLRRSSTLELGEATCSVGVAGLAAAATLGWPEIPGFELLSMLGRGGFGIVFKAREMALDRLVALKMMRDGFFADDRLKLRFQREAQALAHLDHPNVIPILGNGLYRGLPYFTMKLVTGGSLADRQGGCLADPRGAVALIVKIAGAVHYLHERKLVHRDLKPSNILLDQDGAPYVSDFGLVKVLDDDLELTRTGEALGTVAYMAPEQLDAKTDKVTPAADVWSLGVMLYELLSGRRPFGHTNRDQLLRLIATGEPDSLRLLQPKIDPTLEAIVGKCLTKNPQRRFASAQELADELRRWLDGEPTQTRPLSWPARLWRKVRKRPRWAISLAGAALALLAIALFQRLDPDRPLRGMVRDLTAGKPVRPISDDGQLAWHRWALGKTDWVSGGPASGVVTLQTFNLALLEVLPEVPVKRYQISVRVRHEQSDIGEVGLFLGLRSVPTDSGPALMYCSVTFNDLEPDAGAKVNGGNPVFSHLNLIRDDDPGRKIAAVPLSRYRCALVDFFQAAQVNANGPWRSLAVDVAEDEVRAHWEGGNPRVLKAAVFVEAARFLASRAPTKLEPPESIPHRGSIGLLVHGGQASFRDLEIRPLED